MDARQMPVQTSYNAEYTYSEKGKIRNRLYAGQLDQFVGENGHLDASQGLTFIFLDSLEQEEARLTSIRGVYYEKEKKMVVTDSVELRNAAGEKLETQELIFLQDSGKIFTDKFVTIKLEKEILYGTGFDADQDLSNYTMKNPEGEFEVED